MDQFIFVKGKPMFQLHVTKSERELYFLWKYVNLYTDDSKYQIFCNTNWKEALILNEIKI